MIKMGNIGVRVLGVVLFLLFPVSVNPTKANLHTAGWTEPGTNHYPDAGMRRTKYSTSGRFSGIRSSVIDPSGDYLYFGSAHPRVVQKIRLPELSVESSLTLGPGMQLNSAIIQPSGETACFFSYDSLGVVSQVDLASMTILRELDLSPDENGLFEAMQSPTEPVAFCLSGNKLIKLDLELLRKESVLALDPDPGYLRCTAISPDGLHGYIGTQGGNGLIFRIDLTTMSEDGRLYLEPDETWQKDIIIDNSGEYAYIFTSNIVRVSLDDFSRVDALSLPDGFLATGPIMIDPSSDTLYFFLRLTADSEHFGVVNLTTFDSIDIFPVTGPGHSFSTSVIDPSAQRMFACSDSEEPMVVEFSLPDLNYVNSVTFDEAYGYISHVVDPSGTFAYLGTDSTPSKIVKFNLSTFQEIDSITLDSDEGQPYCASIDYAGANAYFLTSQPTEKLIKINLSTFEKSNVIDVVHAGEVQFHTILIQPGDRYAYFLSLESVTKYDLLSFEYIDSLFLAHHFDQTSLTCGFFDVSGQYLYIGLNALPYQLLRLDTDCFTLLDSHIIDFEGEPEPLRQMKFAFSDDDYTDKIYCGFHPGGFFSIDLMTFESTKLPSWNSMEAPAIYDQENKILFAPNSTGSSEDFGIDKLDLSSGQYLGTYCEEPRGDIHAGPNLPEMYIFTGAHPGEAIQLNSDKRGIIVASRCIMPESGSISEISLYSHEEDYQARLAIYDDQEPKQLLWQSDSIEITIPNAINHVAIESGFPTSLNLDRGDYWIVWQINTYKCGPSYTAGSESDGFYSDLAFGEYPAVLNANQITCTTDVWTEYLSYYPVETTPTPVPETIRVTLELPQFAHPGDEFQVTGIITNTGDSIYNVPVFFILDVFGELWFWDDWDHYSSDGGGTIDFRLMDLPTGELQIDVVSKFIWPDTGSDLVMGLRFWGAVCNSDFTDIIGAYDMKQWGYGPN